MYYRRKFLLGFIEYFGGNLKRTYLEKLLFLYMKDNDSKIYSFFPYKYGSFSIISYQDKEILINQQFLQDTEDFRLEEDISFFPILKKEDQKNIRELHRKYSDKSIEEIVRESYLQYPSFAARSKIKNRILSKQELSEIDQYNKQESDNIIFSLGYEGITIDEYLNRLLKNNIKIVIDVRKNPQSMKYNFNKKRFREFLKLAKIQYIHLPDLGIPSELRKNLKSKTDYQALFKLYRKDILADNELILDKIMEIFKKESRVALTCFEADADFCHRKQITNEIKNRFNEVQIKHL
ncbi:MAG: DUF488 family protein [Candidatus Cloacimonadales bacterium]